MKGNANNTNEKMRKLENQRISKWGTSLSQRNEAVPCEVTFWNINFGKGRSTTGNRKLENQKISKWVVIKKVF